MGKILMLIHNGFEEIEALTTVDLCRRGGLEVCVCSMTGNETLQGAHGIQVVADAQYEDVVADAYDMVVLPGGLPNATSLRDDDRVIHTLQLFNRQDKWLGAICAAPIALERAGLLRGRKATSYPGCLEDSSACLYLEAPVAVDGKIVTSRGVGTAIAFALQIIELLVSAEKAKEIGKGILYENS
ncbi:MAG: DJ-1/PfpI family protein [Clostridia bacterium]|nr:DJ-1/PfpI family protein [Clostridia bacterium]